MAGSCPLHSRCFDTECPRCRVEVTLEVQEMEKLPIDKYTKQILINQLAILRALTHGPGSQLVTRAVNDTTKLLTTGKIEKSDEEF